MRFRVTFPALAAVLAGALILFHDATPDSPAGHEDLARAREVTALRAHFDSVDAELRSRPTIHLAPDQGAVRLSLIGWLREYRHAGAFPRNDRFPVAMPFFRDSEGTLCAMAYLIERSGRGDLVDRIAATRNNAFIAELADDSELRAWLESAGLTVAEAARIQPTYWPIDEVEDEVSSDYAITSILVSGSSLATLGLNLISPDRNTGWAGLVLGSVATIAGAANLDGNDATRTVAAANLIVGGGAMAAGLYRLLELRPAPSMNAVTAKSSDRDAQLALSPLVLPSLAGLRFGLAMHTSF